ncbi:hypothetical protein [Williamsia sp.]
MSAPRVIRKITLNVILFIGSRILNSSPSGQLSLSRSVSSSVIFSQLLMF